MDRCSTNELIYDLGITFTRPRNKTFDRFQLITVQTNSNENLETFFSRLRELGSKAALGNVEEDLIKDFFIAKMNNSAIQKELLSEVRTPAQLLNFALSRERGQENQREILCANPSNWNQVNATTQQNSGPQMRPQTSVQRQQTTQELQPCWRSGAPSHKDTILTVQRNKHNVTSVKRWDVLQSYVDQKCQNVQDHGHPKEPHNKHTTNPQGTMK